MTADQPDLRAESRQILEIVAHEGMDVSEPDRVRLIELDSLLVAEIVTLMEDACGHALAIESIDPQQTSVGDVVRFCEQQGR